VCGRYFLKLTGDEAAGVFGALARPPVPMEPRFNIAPGQKIAAVRSGSAGRELVALSWGLLPPWADDEKIAFRMINARAETAHQKPAFREAFRHRRCLIPASGFYEWKQSPGAPKQPFALFREGGETFAMAGLWESWRNPSTGEAKETCTIMTCPANPRLRPIHDRMPVIIPAVDQDLWLDPRLQGVEPLLALMKPDPARHWTIRPVSRRVNTPRNDDAALLDQAVDESSGLFGPG
jgi:putative SOS response-associated peptidase YedK